MTEKETEMWLERETRPLLMPDGNRRPFTMTKLHWNSLEYLTLAGFYTEQELVELTAKNAVETGRTFERHFPNVLAYIHQYIKAQGID